MTALRFVEGDLDSPDVVALLAEHLAGMQPHSPPESIHALPVNALRHPDISFWSARIDDGRLAGMGALRTLDPAHGEIKSMRTVSALHRSGVGAAMLEHLLDTARARGFARVSLETGTADFFEPARALYRTRGFAPCGPFGDYREDRFSCFMTLVL